MKRQYVAIDLKSFYASVECFERGLNPLTARLVVADESRTAKTICLAVSPALESYGIPGRARLFEVKARLAEIKRQTGEDIDRRKIVLAKPIKETGVEEVEIKLFQDVSAKVKVSIEGQ